MTVSVYPSYWMLRHRPEAPGRAWIGNRQGEHEDREKGVEVGKRSMWEGRHGSRGGSEPTLDNSRATNISGRHRCYSSVERRVVVEPYGTVEAQSTVLCHSIRSTLGKADAIILTPLQVLDIIGVAPRHFKN